MSVPRRLSIQLLGEPRIEHDGSAPPLPQSRKTRALLAYLALNPHRLRRDALCDLLWNGPDDPRAALRWSLSKLKPLLVDAAGSVLSVDREGIALDPTRVHVDLLHIERLLDAAGDAPDEATLGEWAQAFEAGYLKGLDEAGTTEFGLWLESQRDAARTLHARVLDALLARLAASPARALPVARQRLALDPLSAGAIQEALRLTLQLGGLSQARELFEALRTRHREEQLSDEPLRTAWSTVSAVQLVSQPDPADTVQPALPDRPSLAVLAFEELGAHPDGNVLGTGLAVDLTSRLSQLPYLFVTARASAVRLAAQGLRPREIGERLGVRYLIEGSAQQHGKRVRVTVNLLDAPRETELWSERYDRPLDDLFLVQDEITNAVVAAIEPAIERAEMERSLLAPPESLSAWEHFHRGLWHCFRFTAADNEQAHRLLQKAVELDPRFSRAYAGLSFTHYSRAFLAAVPDVEGEVARALELARTSVDLDGRDAMGHWCLGRALFLSRQHDDALVAIDRSLATNPSFAVGHYARGFVGIHAGQDDTAVRSLDVAQRLSPLDPLLFAMKASRAISLANRGQSDEAASWAVRATQEPNAHFHIYAIAAACLELAGRTEEARHNAGRALQLKPDYTVQVFQRSFPNRDEARSEGLFGAMARAGIPRGARARPRGRMV